MGSKEILGNIVKSGSDEIQMIADSSRNCCSIFTPANSFVPAVGIKKFQFEMHAFVEIPGTSRCDCVVQSLSWMGKTPDNQPESGAWRLNEANYYNQGWLASGNARGIVGVTFTACQSKVPDQPPRTNFYLRGHRSEVILVKWNEPYQKLATCDVTGIIFVWIKHDGRWSIELINDRSSQVTDFAWSHDGQMALICYKDSFVLVGSVAGQRYWSTMLNLDGCTVTCGIWTPDDQKVMFGTTAGKVVVMSNSGTMVSQVSIHSDFEITHLGWSSERFYLVEPDSSDAQRADSLTSKETRPYILSVVLSAGDILLMTGYDDLCPKYIHTGLSGVKMEWSNDGELLAVAGYIRLPNQDCQNELRFYRRSARLQFVLTLPGQSKQQVNAITWGHNDKRVFVSVGCEIFTVWVFKQVASLQLLCQSCIQQKLTEERMISQLPLPSKLQSSVSDLFAPTIKGYIPHSGKLREFVCTPPPGKDRLHCTIIRHGDETSGGFYVLYLEHLGGLIPLLKGKRASKLHPDFIIYDPQAKSTSKPEDDVATSFANSDSMLEDSDSDGNARDGCGSPSTRRKKRLRKLRDSLKCRESASAEAASEETAYEDSLPEVSHLVSITSNIWGTKFRFNGLIPFLPDDLGSVTYKTSLLHLQPRQMTVSIVELSNDFDLIDSDCIPNSFLSEGEDEISSNFVYETDELGKTSSSTTLIYSTTDTDSGFGSSITTSSNANGSRSPKFRPKQTSPSHHPSPTGNLVIDKSLKLKPNGGPSTTSSSLFLLGPNNLALQRKNAYSQLQTDRLTRVSPTEVNPFIEFFMQDRPPVVVNNSNNRLLSAAAGDPMDENSIVPPVFLRSVFNGANNMTAGKNAKSNDLSLVAIESKSKNGETGSNNKTASVIISGPPQRWADRACQELQYIDDDSDDKWDLYERQCNNRDAVYCTGVAGMSAREIMQSTQMLAEIDCTVPPGRRLELDRDPPANESKQLDSDNFATLEIEIDDSSCDECAMGPVFISPRSDDKVLGQDTKFYVCGTTVVESSCGGESHSVVVADVQSVCSYEPRKTRLVLTNSPESKPKSSKLREMARNALCNNRTKRRLFTGLCGIANPLIPGGGMEEGIIKSSDSSPRTSNPNSPVTPRKHIHHRCGSLDVRHSGEGANVLLPPPASTQSTSLPASPVHKLGCRKQGRLKQQQLPNQFTGRSKLQSPLMRHRLRSNSRPFDSSDEEHTMSAEEITTSENYRNLETFQKAQLNKKLRKARTKCDTEVLVVEPASSGPSSPRNSPQHGQSATSPAVRRRKPTLRNFVMYNKAPMWNDSSQVYQLDFGGRVTQESAKNFQIEFGGKQVMQFGRIDNNAYTLDFQYPYSAIQAFAVALANVTQRLK